MIHGRIVLLLLIVAASLSFPVHAITVIDDREKPVTLDQPATRIISLSPHITELLYHIGAGDKLVATVAYSDFPPPAQDLPRIGDAMRIDMELALSFKPDLVVAWLTGNSPGDLEKLEKLGIDVYVIEIGALDQIEVQLKNLGRLSGVEPSADKQAAEYRQNLDRLRDKYQNRGPVSVFYQIWDSPLMTINDRHIISDGIRLCSGMNLFPDLEPIASAVSLEAVLAEDPDVIIANASERDSEAVLNVWRQWKSLTAVRNNQLYTIPHEYIARSTPRILKGVEQICLALERARNSQPRE